MSISKDQILRLSMNDVIESAGFFSRTLKDTPLLIAEEEVKELYPQDPYEHVKTLEAVSRILLINAIEHPEYRPIVEKSVDSAGRKNFILGSAEIIGLSLALVAALKIVLNPTSEESFEYKDKEGTHIKYTKKHTSDTNFLSKIFDKLFNK